MNYECPSCKITWKDTQEPIEQIAYCVCVFCSLSHTQKELLNWQINHLEEIRHENFFLVLRNLYQYVDDQLKLLSLKINDIERNGRKES